MTETDSLSYVEKQQRADAKAIARAQVIVAEYEQSQNTTIPKGLEKGDVEQLKIILNEMTPRSRTQEELDAQGNRLKSDDAPFQAGALLHPEDSARTGLRAFDLQVILRKEPKETP